jgi:hypothetical protein
VTRAPKNPFTMLLLRKHLADTTWRTVGEIAVRLTPHVPVETIARTINHEAPRLRLRPLADQIDGRRRDLVRLAILAAARRQVFEKRRGDYGMEYRYCPAGPKSRPCVMAARLRALIVKQPGLTMAELAERLGPEIDDKLALSRYVNKLVWQAKAKSRSRSAAIRREVFRNPEKYLAVARHGVVSTILYRLMARRYIRKAKYPGRPYIYFPTDLSLGEGPCAP